MIAVRRDIFNFCYDCQKPSFKRDDQIDLNDNKL